MHTKSIHHLMDLSPDLYFFAKDASGQFTHVNQAFARLCQVDDAAQLLGRTDSDFFPAARAQVYMNDDQLVMGTRTPLVNRVEPVPAPRRKPGLLVTTKVPLTNPDGEVVGVVGMARDLRLTESAVLTHGCLPKSMAYIDAHFRKAIRVEHLAALEGMSVSRYEKLFKELFGATPKLHIQQKRLRHACRLLAETNQSIAAIARECGYYDHSHFSHYFRKLVGIPPLRYRKQHR